MASNLSNQELYNNPDSFAMMFDEAWKSLDGLDDKELGTDKKIDVVFRIIKNHPFLSQNPKQAKDIAKFRIKLLNLK